MERRLRATLLNCSTSSATISEGDSVSSGALFGCFKTGTPFLRDFIDLIDLGSQTERRAQKVTKTMSRSPENDKPTEKKFLFINKDASSTSFSARRSDKQALRTITSHAQRWRVDNARQRKIKSTQQAAQPTQQLAGWRLAGSADQSGSTSVSSSATPPSQNLSLGSLTPNPSTHMTGNSTDPFMYLDSPEDAWWSHDAFQYSVSIFLPTLFKSIINLKPSNPFGQDPTMHRIIQGCLQNKLHMYSLLAASTGRLKFVQRESLKRLDSPEFCTAKAIQHLREYLTSFDKLEEQVIFDLVALATLEGYVNNYDGARTHLRMVSHLVKTLGGFGALDVSLCGLCYMRDLLVASIIDEPPIFGLMFDPGPLPLAAWREVRVGLSVADSRPMGTSLLAATSSMGDDFPSIVRDLVQCAQVFQYRSVNDSTEAVSYEDWAVKRSYALRHRLLGQQVTSGQSQSIFTILLECVRLTLLIWASNLGVTATRRSHPARSAAYSGAAVPLTLTRLRRAYTRLRELGGISAKEHENVVVWMISLAKRQSLAGSDKDFFRHELQMLLRIANIRDVAQLNGLLLGFVGPINAWGERDFVLLMNISEARQLLTLR